MTHKPKPVASATAVAAVPKKTSNRFGIAVGTYLNEERAATERSALAGSTQLSGRVVTTTQDSVSVYEVVMGSFESRLAAEKAASDLIRKGLVNEARVVPVARATTTGP